jgi:hypothetical protein
MERIVKVLPPKDAPVSARTGEAYPHAETHPLPSSESEAASSWGNTGALPGRRMTFAIGGAIGVLLLGGAALALRSTFAAPAAVATPGPAPAPTVEIQNPLRVQPVEAKSADPSPAPPATASGEHAAASATAPAGPKAAAPARVPGPAAPKPSAPATAAPTTKPSVDPMERWN